MHRVFMVEDNKPTRRNFRKALLSKMPDAEFVEASSIPKAEAIIQDYAARGLSFDAVILDCNLPSAESTLAMDVTLCPLVSQTFREALVVHCSVFGDSEELQRHIHAEHRRANPRACVIPKNEGWDQDLIKALAADRVERRLADFFTGGGGPPAGQFGRGGATRRLAELVADIEQFWPLLPSQLQERVKSDFDVVPSGKSVLVTPGGSRG